MGRRRDRGQRAGHPRGDRAQDLRPVLHDQAAREGDGPRSLHELLHRDAEARGTDPRAVTARVHPLHGEAADQPAIAGGIRRQSVMTKPVIMCVDDDPEVLGAIERDLRHRYGSEYRILKAKSGREALEAVRQLKQRGTAIALFLVDERMPEMTGTELLREVLKLYPESRRVLLTAYSDTQAAISGINDLGLDYYLLKPWTPPGERLYPVVDDLLSDWTAHVRLPYDGIRLAGDRSSPRSYAVKEFLSSNQIPYQWVDIDQDPSMRELINSF